MEDRDALARHVEALLRGGQAHETFEQIAGSFAPGQQAIVPAGARRSAWQILEHMRICQRDILDFSTNEDGHYTELDWPEGYWPKAPAPGSGSGAGFLDWNDSVREFVADRDELIALVHDRSRDLFAPFSWGDGQTLLREALLAADHASYHLGELVMVRRMITGEE